MNHRRSRGGYHSLLAAGTLGAAAVLGCAPPQFTARPRGASDAPGAPWAAERAAVVAQINAARRAIGVDPLEYDGLLQRVGDAHCRILIEEGGDGHFSRSGVPPYLRYFLAGGHGFHRENIGSTSSTAPVEDAEMGEVLRRGVDAMLAELPPQDGHRRSLLDPWATHIGVGLARQGGQVRMAHEIATEVTEAWLAPPVAAPPRTVATLAGRLASPWRAEAAEVLWEELPHPLSDEQAAAIRSYGYPPRRWMAVANRPVPEGSGQGLPEPFTADRHGNFSFRWTTGPHEGVEIVLIWARYGANAEMIPVAASATVVTGTGELPPVLDAWRRLGADPGAVTGAT